MYIYIIIYVYIYIYIHVCIDQVLPDLSSPPPHLKKSRSMNFWGHGVERRERGERERENRLRSPFALQVLPAPETPHNV